MDTDFVNWLMSETQRRGWNNSELSRRAGVVHSTISLLLNRKTNPGTDVCQGIARAFNMPPEDVYRRAGLLPNLPDDPNQAQEKRLCDLYRRLPERLRERVIDYAVFEYERMVTKEQAPDS